MLSFINSIRFIWNLDASVGIFHFRDYNEYSYNISTLFSPYTGFGDICKERRHSSDAANTAFE